MQMTRNEDSDFRDDLNLAFNTTGRPPSRKEKLQTLVFLAAALAILVLLAAGFYGLLVAVVGKPEQLGGTLIKVALSTVMVLTAVGLYILKGSRGQALYGLAEIAGGLVVNWRALDGLAHQAPNTTFVRLTILIGGLYLIGRGITDLFEGLQRFLPDSAKNSGFLRTLIMAFKDGYDKPVNLPIPKTLVDYYRAKDPSLTKKTTD